MAWHAPFPPLGLEVAGAALAGALVVQVFPDLPPAWFSLLLLLGGLVELRRGGVRRLLAAATVALAWTCLIAGARLDARLPTSASPWDGAVTGTVIGLPQRSEDALRFEFRVDADRQLPIAGGSRLRLTWHGSRLRSLQPGSRWQFAVRLRAPGGVLNPGSRDAERAAFAQAVAATGYVRTFPRPRPISTGGGVDALRESISAHIGTALPDGRGRFIRALAVGDTRGIQDEDWTVLRATGLTHQIAISGFHVGLVAGLGALLARLAWWVVPALGRRWARPQAAALAAFLMASGYTALAGLALPTVRTLLMLGVLLVVRLWRRAAAPRAGLALALLLMLAFDPLAVLSAGFWLSFAGVAWLMWCLPRAEGGLRGAGSGLLRAQGVALVGLLPLTVWFFGQASLPGPLANLVGVPLISLVVVPLALVGIALVPVAPAWAAFAWQMSASVMDGLWRLLEAMAAWPSALAWLPEPDWLAIALAVAGAGWCLLPRVVPDRGLALLLFLPLLWPASIAPPMGEVDVQVLDVGQGLAVLVRTHGHELLYDTGAAGGRGPDRGETVVVPALHALGVSHLDLVMVSHESRDHAGGLDAVRAAWPDVRVVGPEGWARPGMGLCERGAHWRWDEVDFRVLHPPPDFPRLGRDGSCVLRVAAGAHAVLLPGDIGDVVQRRLLALEAEHLRADIVIAPRHGARGGSDPSFVRAAEPRWIVFSTGAEHRTRLPLPEQVEAWTRGGARALDTQQTGSLRFRLSPRAARLVEERRADHRRYWRRVGPAASPGAGSGYASGHATTDR